MNAKRSVVLLLGLLLMAILAVWSQTPDKPRPVCPPVADGMLQSMLVPTAWVRADWNANAKQWEIDCTQIDSIANMPAPGPANGANVGPRKAPRRRGNQ